MATISKVRRLTNPGMFSKAKRKLSPLQKMFFGSKRQRAAVSRSNPGFNRKQKRAQAVNSKAGVFSSAKSQHYGSAHFGRQARKYTKARTRAVGYKYAGRSEYTSMPKPRLPNVGSIITVWPKGHSNPGRRKLTTSQKSLRKWIRKEGGTIPKYKRISTRKRNGGAKNRLVIVNPGGKMAKGSGRVISGYGSTVMNRGKKRMATKRRRKVSRISNRRRRNSGTRQGRSWSTYTKSKAKRKSNPGRRTYHRRRITNRYHRRRNPGMLTGTAGRVLGVVGGVAVTKLLTGFLPAMFATGFMSYIGIGAIAVLQGKLVAKFAKSEALGNDMMVGGLAYLAAKILNDFFPTIGAYTGMAGMGMIGGNSYYVPQVNQAGSMGNFMIPPAIRSYVAGAIPVAAAAHAGVGTMRRTGRLM